MWRHIAANGLTLLILGLAVLGAVIGWGRVQYTAPGPLEEAVCLRVERGATMRSVSRQLAGEGAVSSPLLFRAGADYTDRADALKAGSYLIHPGDSMDAITGAMTAGGASTCGREVNFRIGVTAAEVVLRALDPATEDYEEVVSFPADAGEVPKAYREESAAAETRFRVILAEGVTSWQVAEALRAAPFLAGDIAETPAEGHLAPGSYEVPRDSARAALIERMEARQARVLDDLWTARAGDLPLETKEEALTLASLVEKETGVPGERAEVAAVFVNRLEQGMRLQTDPTVRYGLTEGREPLGRGLRKSELARQTPYNTYLIDGLPPTPIANPGRAAIEAALNPAKSDYLYFVADGSGGHAFSETLSEHNENVARWREIEQDRATGE